MTTYEFCQAHTTLAIYPIETETGKDELHIKGTAKEHGVYYMYYVYVHVHSGNSEYRKSSIYWIDDNDVYFYVNGKKIYLIKILNLMKK